MVGNMRLIPACELKVPPEHNIAQWHFIAAATILLCDRKMMDLCISQKRSMLCPHWYVFAPARINLFLIVVIDGFLGHLRSDVIHDDLSCELQVLLLGLRGLTSVRAER